MLGERTDLEAHSAGCWGIGCLDIGRLQGTKRCNYQHQSGGVRSCSDLGGAGRRATIGTRTERVQLLGPSRRSAQLPGPGWKNAQLPGPGRQSARQPEPRPARACPALAQSGSESSAEACPSRSPADSRPFCALSACAPLAPPPVALALPAGPAEAVCALCQRAPREPVRADCGHRFCRACVVRFWAEEDGPFPCPECADDCWQRAVEPGRPPLSRRLLALEEAAAAPARDGPASEAALQLLCRADGDPLCSACRMAAGPEPPEWEPRWRKALRGKGHVMDRRKKALTDYRKLRAFFVEEEEHFLQEAEKDEGTSEDDELADPADRFRSLLQAVSELEKKHRNLGLSMLLQGWPGEQKPPGLEDNRLDAQDGPSLQAEELPECQGRTGRQEQRSGGSESSSPE
ncbi:E3 ubiquitin-protein ligase RNF187 [Microtus ochrogaster]|uniref:E3 ubiquitin-protein ligase RNF187 n=1 Tax=Microtus ochrogaster TaxID=79684 RepID=A0A8J6G501_MICOH|nr:E3 ubiquitin-protein ligase RNF187 [Microtus ochrogaster]